MPTYRYMARDMQGKPVNGVLDAANRQDAMNTLTKQDVLIISLVEEKAKHKESSPAVSGKKVRLDDLVVFGRQLATMIEAGIPLVGAMDILGQQTESKEFKGIIFDVRDRVEAGSSLSDALAKYSGVFSELFVNMVKAGEASGMLDVILDRVAEYMEKTNGLQKKIKSALMYPFTVASIALGVTLFLLWKVIPVFKEIYSGFGAELPKPTQILIAVSDSLGKYMFLGIGLAAIAVIAVNSYIRTERGRLLVDRATLGLPVFGILFKKVAVGKFTRTLSTLLKSGVPILTALEIVGKTSGNKAVEEAIEKVRINVHEGENISEPLMKSRIFPVMVTRMVSVGEKSGELEKMLSKVADFYDGEVETAVGGLTSLIEPLIIVFLGLVLGTIVICMFLPIFKITSIIGA